MGASVLMLESVNAFHGDTKWLKNDDNSDSSNEEIIIYLETELLSRKDTENAAPFPCLLCNNRFFSIENAIEHTTETHSDWKSKFSIYDAENATYTYNQFLFRRNARECANPLQRRYACKRILETDRT